MRRSKDPSTSPPQSKKRKRKSGQQVGRPRESQQGTNRGHRAKKAAGHQQRPQGPRRPLDTGRGHRGPGGHWTQAEVTGIQEEAGPLCHYLLGPAQSGKRNERGGRAVGEAFAGPDLTDHELDG